jgi:hypothetical protein
MCALGCGASADVLRVPIDSPLQRQAQARPTLPAYSQRMKARYHA